MVSRLLALYNLADLFRFPPARPSVLSNGLIRLGKVREVVVISKGLIRPGGADGEGGVH